MKQVPPVISPRPAELDSIAEECRLAALITTNNLPEKVTYKDYGSFLQNDQCINSIKYQLNRAGSPVSSLSRTMGNSPVNQKIVYSPKIYRGLSNKFIMKYASL